MEQTVTAVHPTAYIFVFITLAGALLAIRMHNILHATFGLALSLLGIAALFAYLGSPFLAAMEVLIYAGGISVAMVFAVMFSYSIDSTDSASRIRTLFAALCTLAFLGGAGTILWRASFPLAEVGRDWSLEAVGRALLQHYNLVFEALSVILLLAIVGAIIIARRGQDASTSPASARESEHLGRQSE